MQVMQGIKQSKINRNRGTLIMENFFVDTASCNDTYFYLDIPAKGVSLQIKIESEGVVVDAFPMYDCTGSESLATMCVCDSDQ